ncbi:MAG: sugar phosphate isomerase/epimerase family protein [Sulfitobacter dubius]
MRYVFWPAAVRTHGFATHVRAARIGGFTHLAVDPITWRNARADGLSDTDMVTMAGDAGLTISHLDTITDWAPIRVPDEVNPALAGKFDIDADECFRMCAGLGITDMLAVAGYDLGAVPFDTLVDGFGRLCDRAKAEGIWVDLEFMPFWGLPNLEDAWAIVEAVGANNSGILIDTWHFPKGKYDPDLLRSIPELHLKSCQVADALKQQEGTSLFDDTAHYRKFGGEGEMPVVEILSILREKGLENIGPEVFSDAADAMHVDDVGRVSGSTLRNVMTSAGFDIPENVLAV